MCVLCSVVVRDCMKCLLLMSVATAVVPRTCGSGLRLRVVGVVVVVEVMVLCCDCWMCVLIWTVLSAVMILMK